MTLDDILYSYQTKIYHKEKTSLFLEAIHIRDYDSLTRMFKIAKESNINLFAHRSTHTNLIQIIKQSCDSLKNEKEEDKWISFLYQNQFSIFIKDIKCFESEHSYKPYLYMYHMSLSNFSERLRRKFYQHEIENVIINLNDDYFIYVLESTSYFHDNAFRDSVLIPLYKRGELIQHFFKISIGSSSSLFNNNYSKNHTPVIEDVVDIFPKKLPDQDYILNQDQTDYFHNKLQESEDVNFLMRFKEKTHIDFETLSNLVFDKYKLNVNFEEERKKVHDDNTIKHFLFLKRDDSNSFFNYINKIYAFNQVNSERLILGEHFSNTKNHVHCLKFLISVISGNSQNFLEDFLYTNEIFNEKDKQAIDKKIRDFIIEQKIKPDRMHFLNLFNPITVENYQNQYPMNFEDFKYIIDHHFSEADLIFMAGSINKNLRNYGFEYSSLYTLNELMKKVSYVYEKIPAKHIEDMFFSVPMTHQIRLLKKSPVLISPYILSNKLMLQFFDSENIKYKIYAF